MSQTSLPAHIQALLRPETYPHPVANIEMMQTHISWIFLTGDYAYKLKKPLDLGFLDFSTLSRRKFFCEQELSLNRRLSADIYLDVLPLCREGDHFRLGGAGKVLEYCLKMRQFDQSGLFDQRLASNQFDPAWMDGLAENTARFHAAQQGSVEFGQPHILADHIRANLEVAENHVGDALDESTMSELAVFAADAEIHISPNHGLEPVLLAYSYGFLQMLVKNVKLPAVAEPVQVLSPSQIPGFVHANMNPAALKGLPNLRNHFIN